MTKFSIVPNIITEDPNITFNELRVFIALCSFANSDDKSCYPSLKRIASRCAVKQISNISRAIKGLVDKGYVEKDVQHCSNGAQQTNVYTISFELKVQMMGENVNFLDSSDQGEGDAEESQSTQGLDTPYQIDKGGVYQNDKGAPYQFDKGGDYRTDKGVSHKTTKSKSQPRFSTPYQNDKGGAYQSDKRFIASDKSYNSNNRPVIKTLSDERAKVSSSSDFDFEEMIKIWNDKTGQSSRKSVSRRKRLTTFFNNKDYCKGSMEFWKDYCKRIAESDFLMNKFKVTIDWVTKPANADKILDGNYDGSRNFGGSVIDEEARRKALAKLDEQDCEPIQIVTN